MLQQAVPYYVLSQVHQLSSGSILHKVSGDDASGASMEWLGCLHGQDTSRAGMAYRLAARCHHWSLNLQAAFAGGKPRPCSEFNFTLATLHQ